MKDEEMAKQFADNINGLDLTCSLLSAKDKSHAYRLGRYDGFFAGLKAGRQDDQLTKAKEVIKGSIVLLTKPRTALDTKTYLMKARQFLKEVIK